MLDAPTIARVLKVKESNVETLLPMLRDAFGADWTPNVAVAALATIKVETLIFWPIKEFGGDKYLNKHYDTGEMAKRLGNTPEADGDGARYCGHGLIQLTGRANYIIYGHIIGVDLLANPEAALLPQNAVKIFAAYFRREGILPLAARADWIAIRHRVNGGSNGMDEYLAAVHELLPCAA